MEEMDFLVRRFDALKPVRGGASPHSVSEGPGFFAAFFDLQILKIHDFQATLASARQGLEIALAPHVEHGDSPIYSGFDRPSYS